MNADRVIRCIALLVLLAGFQPALGQISTDHVMQSGFEAVPLEVFPRIEFVGDRSLVFSATGQTRGIQVRVFDAAGKLVPDPAVVWQPAMPGNVSVEAHGAGDATVQSVAAWTGSMPLTVSYPPLGVQVQGEAVFATLVPGTVWIDSAWVSAILGDRGEAHRIVLRRNSITDGLQPDDIIVSGDHAGIVAHVVSVEIGATSINLEVVPALLTDAYENVEFAGEGEPLSVALKLVGDSATLTVRSKRNGAVLQRESLTKADVLSLVECEDALGLALELTGLSLEWSLVPRAGLRIEWGEVVDFFVLVEGGVGIDASASLKPTGNISLSRKCEARLPSIALAAIPAGPLYVSPTVVPGAKVSASASASFGMDYVPVRLKRGWSFRTGVRYTATNGWSTIAEAGADTVTATSNPFIIESGFAIKVAAGAHLEGGITFYLGYPTPRAELAFVKLIEVDGGPFKEWRLDAPVSPIHPEYTGPRVESGTEASARLSFTAELFKGTLSKYLPLTLEADLGLTFFRGRFVYERLPAVTGDIQCSALCTMLEPGAGLLTLRMMADTPDTGTAEFWVRAGNSDSLSLLASTQFSQGVGRVEQPVPTTLGLGDFEVFARLRLDGEANVFTQLTPLAAAGAIGGFSVVVDARTVTVQKLDNANNQLTLGGLVESSGTAITPAINCGFLCAGTAIAGTTVVLIARDVGGWTFVRWAEGGACAGSTDPQCSFLVDSSATAKAVFVLNNDFSFEVAEAERPWDPLEYPRLSCSHYEGEYQISGYFASFDRCYSGMSAVIRCVGAGCSSSRFKVAIRKSVLSGTVVGRGADCDSYQDPYGIAPGSGQIYPGPGSWYGLDQGWTKAWPSVTNISPLPNYSFIFQNFRWIGADPGLPCSGDTTATLEVEFNVYDVATGNYTVIPFVMTVP